MRAIVALPRALAFPWQASDPVVPHGDDLRRGHRHEHTDEEPPAVVEYSEPRAVRFPKACDAAKEFLGRGDAVASEPGRHQGTRAVGLLMTEIQLAAVRVPFRMCAAGG